MQITFNSSIRLQLLRSLGPGSGSAKSKGKTCVYYKIFENEEFELVASLKIFIALRCWHYQIKRCLNKKLYTTELASKLPKVDRHFSTYMKRKKSTFCFAKVNEVKVYLLLESINTKKSFGYDKVHPLLLSSAALEIFQLLTRIIMINNICHLNMAYFQIT